MMDALINWMVGVPADVIGGIIWLGHNPGIAAALTLTATGLFAKFGMDLVERRRRDR
jgi:hypothetical protein